MTMPIGKSFEHGYATVEEGCGYRVISELMTERGDTMNHCTARNVFLSAMTKFASQALSLYGNDVNDAVKCQELARDPRFQEAIMSFLVELDPFDLDEAKKNNEMGKV